MSAPVCLNDYDALARASLPAAHSAYLFGGAADEVSLDANRRSFDRLSLVPRVLRDLRHFSTATELFGTTMASPVIVAPMAYQRLFHQDGEIGIARAAAAMGLIYTLSCQASTDLAAVAAAGEAHPQWFQLYLQAKRDETLALVKRAEDAGYLALVVTVDAPVSGIRNAEWRTGFALPDTISAVNLRSAELTAPQSLAGRLAHVARWDDIRWLRSQTKLPLIIKGILHPDDAALALELGADGIIVSNHGGRILDTALSPLDALPAIAAEIKTRCPLLLDGGIRRGTDIVKAMALGATAILIGRPILAALAVSGERGAAHALKTLLEEFAVALALCGCANPNEISAHYVRKYPEIS